MGTGYVHGPCVNTDFARTSQKLAKFCNRIEIAKKLVILGISVQLILPQNVGCGQELNQSLFHTSSFPTQHVQPTKTVLDFSQVGNYFTQDQKRIPFSDYGLNDYGSGKENARRWRRQILHPNLKTKTETGIDTNFVQMTDIHINFIADLAIFKGWSTIYIVLPGNVQKLCGHLITMLARSRAGLRCECGDETMNLMPIPLVPRRRVIPIFSFYFLQPANATFILDTTLLVPILPTRPLFVIGGNVLNTRVLVDKVRPVRNGNYKWTLIWADGPTTLMIEDVYGFPEVAPITQVVGKWSQRDGLHIDSELAMGPLDFQGRKLRITTVAGPPMVFVKTTSTGITSTGYLPDILQIISLQLNFTYEVMTPPDQKFGSEEANSSWSGMVKWNGMVGMLQRMEADIAMMSFSLTASRKTVMDFSPPVEYSSVRLLIRRDWQNAELKWYAYWRPLTWDVWATIPIFVCLGVITLSIFSYCKVLDISPSTSAWLLTSCFILQGQDEHSTIKVTPYRLVLGTFWVLSLVVFTSYTARLTAYLAASNEVLPVSDLSQAVKNRNWKVGLVKGSAFIDRIKESRVDVLRKLYQRISDDASALVDSFQEGMDKVFKERYIFFTSELIPSFLIRGNCSYTWLPDKYFSGFGYMGYQKNLPFAPVISQRIAELRQSGQMKRLFQKWWGAEAFCFTKSGESFLGMSMYETGTAFLVLLFGASLSITFIVAEFYSRTRKAITVSETSNNGGAFDTYDRMVQDS